MKHRTPVPSPYQSGSCSGAANRYSNLRNAKEHRVGRCRLNHAQDQAECQIYTLTPQRISPTSPGTTPRSLHIPAQLPPRRSHRPWLHITRICEHGTPPSSDRFEVRKHEHFVRTRGSFRAPARFGSQEELAVLESMFHVKHAGLLRDYQRRCLIP